MFDIKLPILLKKWNDKYPSIDKQVWLSFSSTAEALLVDGEGMALLVYVNSIVLEHKIKQEILIKTMNCFNICAVESVRNPCEEWK